jgi:hypothetical protein
MVVLREEELKGIFVLVNVVLQQRTSGVICASNLAHLALLIVTVFSTTIACERIFATLLSLKDKYRKKFIHFAVEESPVNVFLFTELL